MLIKERFYLGHFVYKYVYNNEIIYIGKNDTNLESRIKQHRREGKFAPYLNADIYYIKMANKTMSDVVESELIRRYKPKLNVAKTSDWCGLDFVEPEWILFQSTSLKTSKKNKPRRRYVSKRDEKITAYKVTIDCCYMLLDNIANVIEDDSEYIIETPVPSRDIHCRLPIYIEYEDEYVYDSLNIESCMEYDGVKKLTFVFSRSAVYKEFHNIPVGLEKRIIYAKSEYERKLNELENYEIF